MQKSESVSKSKIRQDLINFPDLSFEYDVISKEVTLIKAETETCSYLTLTIDECLAIIVALKRFTDNYKIIT